jgi:cytidine deaminase
MTNLKNELIKKAKEAQKGAYAPYSSFHVGAALLTKSGKIYTGFNIENSSYSATVCAERVALFTALNSGEREFSAIAIVGDSESCPPCGVCRQVLSEFCDGEFEIILENGSIFTLSELLPFSFGLNR